VVVVEANRGALAFVVDKVLALCDSRHLRRVIPVRQQPRGDRRWRRRAAREQRAFHVQQGIRDFRIGFAMHRAEDLDRRMIRQVGQPDHFRLLCENSDRPETKRIGCLQEMVELQDLALDAHDKLPFNSLCGWP